VAELTAIFCSGAFFGVALCITSIQHPAALESCWLLGSLLLFAVIPFTLLRVMPVNDQLSAPGREADAADTEPLLRQWGRLHAVRTLLSGLAFAVQLAALAFRSGP
jgi:hypothetical protein